MNSERNGCVAKRIRALPGDRFLAQTCPTACGRLPEFTNGCFVGAEHEKPTLIIGLLWRDPKYGFGWRIQPVGATHSLNLSAGVLKPSVLRGLSFNCLAIELSLACE